MISASNAIRPKVSECDGTSTIRAPRISSASRSPRLRADEVHGAGQLMGLDQRVQVGLIRREVGRDVPGDQQIGPQFGRHLGQRADRARSGPFSGCSRAA